MSLHDFDPVAVLFAGAACIAGGVLVITRVLDEIHKAFDRKRMKHRTEIWDRLRDEYKSRNDF